MPYVPRKTGAHQRRSFVKHLFTVALWALTPGCPTVDQPAANDGQPAPGAPVPNDSVFVPLPVTVEGAGQVTQNATGGIVELTALPDPGWRFDGWLGGINSTLNPISIITSDSTEIAVRFVVDEGDGDGQPGDIAPLPDDDADGVADDRDACSDTPTNETANASGCSASQRDADGDAVNDLVDLCPDTPTGESVNANGCAESQRDSDQDGVANAVDQCPSTRAGDTADATGCAPRQLDTDNDGVTDDRDECADTPSGTTVSVRGCPAECGDGIVELDEACDDGNTVNDDACTNACTLPRCGDAIVQAGEACDAGSNNSDTLPDTCRSDCRMPGCGDAVIDSGEACDPPDGSTCNVSCLSIVCGDQRVDAGEQCDPPDGTTCGTNCRFFVCGNGTVEGLEACDPPDGVACNDRCELIVCGDGTIEGAEACDPPDGTLCSDDCRTIVCGDSRIEGGEQCDPPDTCGCDATCRLTSPANDDCAASTPLSDEAITFNTCGTTTDGPSGVDDCRSGSFERDLWFCYTATCTGLVKADSCSSEFNSILAVYGGCTCPAGPLIACHGNGCNTSGLTAQALFTAVEGESYLLRIGGVSGEQGDGSLSLSCSSGLVCSEVAGDCFSANGSPGCQVESCCDAVCAIDPFCCGDAPEDGGRWDEECVNLTALPALGDACPR